jgi:hypothetical protein
MPEGRSQGRIDLSGFGGHGYGFRFGRRRGLVTGAQVALAAEVVQVASQPFQAAQIVDR